MRNNTDDDDAASEARAHDERARVFYADHEASAIGAHECLGHLLEYDLDMLQSVELAAWDWQYEYC